MALGVDDGGVLLDGDVAGDGFDYVEDRVAEFGVGLGAVEVVDADLVDELWLSAGAARGFDEDFAVLQRDFRGRACL